jgi:hypothetical protein
VVRIDTKLDNLLVNSISAFAAKCERNAAKLWRQWGLRGGVLAIPTRRQDWQ